MVCFISPTFVLFDNPGPGRKTTICYDLLANKSFLLANKSLLLANKSFLLANKSLLLANKSFLLANKTPTREFGCKGKFSIYRQFIFLLCFQTWLLKGAAII
jgi:hypothetical protein